MLSDVHVLTAVPPLITCCQPHEGALVWSQLNSLKLFFNSFVMDNLISVAKVLASTCREYSNYI
jgi:hypothetical protein